MSDSSRRPATGLQIVVLIFAVGILGAAAEKYVFGAWSAELDIPLGRAATFFAAAGILFGVPALRARCLALLSSPLRPAMAAEIGVALSIQLLCAFAVVGAVALWWWSTGGEPALARHMGQGLLPPKPWERAFAPGVLINSLVIGGVLAPIVEELAFRGILYSTWERKWGWVRSAIGTSLAFAFVHPYVVPQFFSSLVLIGLLRRTGSLKACIVCHGGMNIAIWYPLLGHFLTPGAARETGGIRVWAAHLICLFVAFFALAIYLWMSRDEAIAAKHVASHEAAPQQS